MKKQNSVTIDLSKVFETDFNEENVTLLTTSQVENRIKKIDKLKALLKEKKLSNIENSEVNYIKGLEHLFEQFFLLPLPFINQINDNYDYLMEMIDGRRKNLIKEKEDIKNGSRILINEADWPEDYWK